MWCPTWYVSRTYVQSKFVGRLIQYKNNEQRRNLNQSRCWHGCSNKYIYLVVRLWAMCSVCKKSRRYYGIQQCRYKPIFNVLKLDLTLRIRKRVRVRYVGLFRKILEKGRSLSEVEIDVLHRRAGTSEVYRVSLLYPQTLGTYYGLGATEYHKLYSWSIYSISTLDGITSEWWKKLEQMFRKGS